MSIPNIRKSNASSMQEVVLRKTAEFLDARTILAAICVCKNWQTSFNADFWRITCRHDFPDHLENPDNKPFHVQYRELTLHDEPFFVQRLMHANQGLLRVKDQLTRYLKRAKVPLPSTPKTTTELIDLTYDHIDQLVKLRKRYLLLQKAIPAYTKEAERFHKEFMSFRWIVPLQRQFKSLVRLKEKTTSYLLRWHFGKIPPHLM